MDARTQYTQEEVEHAHEVSRETWTWHLQRQDPETGIWRIIGKSVMGRTAALKLLTRAQESRFNDEEKGNFRVLPKNESDKYAEGLSAGQGLGAGARSRGRSRSRSNRQAKPLRYMPEHL